MPNVDKPELINGVLCGPTHHLACDCREAYIKKLEKVREAAEQYVKEAKVHLKYIEDRNATYKDMDIAYCIKYQDLLFQLKQALKECVK